MYPLTVRERRFEAGFAHKIGEVVGPAGGETGGPHCLAEVRKLPKAAYIHYLKEQGQKTLSRIDVKPKNGRKHSFGRDLFLAPSHFNT